jgi:PadR family transcriptional regulator, regulatory protein PadR
MEYNHLMKEIDIEKTKSEMRRGMLEYCILLIISRGKIYASDILKELKAADLIVVEGTLYPLLSRLRSEKLLDYEWEESRSGPPRKYYTLTAKGKENLAELRTTWKSLSSSINTLMN